VNPFIYSTGPARVLFGVGTLARLAEEVDRLGGRRVLVLTTPTQRTLTADVTGRLGPRAAGIFDRAVMHVPVDTARAASDAAHRLAADLLVPVGGGSTTGLAKAIALESGLPILALPTTYAGSEMTSIYGLTDAGGKRTGRDPKVLPKTVIYDPALTVDLPVALSMTSGINALAHAAEGLYAQDRNPITDLLAEEGIRALAAGLPAVRAAPADLDARGACLYGAWLCATVLANVGMALHHKLCHTLGGTFNLPHAQTHTCVLPHALAYNAASAPAAMTRIARALGTTSAAAGVYDLAADQGAPLALRDLGLAERDLDRAAELAAASPYPNPRSIERAALRALLDDAWHGRRPAA
jgi:alcohol dehydrogenase class IV